MMPIEPSPSILAELALAEQTETAVENDATIITDIPPFTLPPTMPPAKITDGITISRNPSVAAFSSTQASIRSASSSISFRHKTPIKPTTSVATAAPVLTTGIDDFMPTTLVRTPSPLSSAQGGPAPTNNAVSALRDAGRLHPEDNKPKSLSKGKDTAPVSNPEDDGDASDRKPDQAEAHARKNAARLMRSEARSRKEVDLKPAKDFGGLLASNARAAVEGRRQPVRTNSLVGSSLAASRTRDLFSVAPHPDLVPMTSLKGKLSRPSRFNDVPENSLSTTQNSPWPESLGSIHPSLDAVAAVAMSATTEVIAMTSRIMEGKVTIPLCEPDKTSSVLAELVRVFTRKSLHPVVPYTGGPDVSLMCGEIDGLVRVLDAFGTSAASLLVEPQINPRAIAVALARNIKVVAIATDDEGMLAFGKGGLCETLASWDSAAHGRPRPHLLYISTVGTNPSGLLMGHARRAEIYSVCRSYGVLIIEDEPHWHLQYPTAQELESAARDPPRSPVDSDDGFHVVTSTDWRPAETGVCPTPFMSPSSSAYVRSLVPSFLRYDVDGRVIRLDSFSNALFPGCQVGWITAQPAIIAVFEAMAVSRAAPSGLAQSAIATMLSQPSYNPAAASGLIRSFAGLRATLESRMDRACNYLEAGTHQLRHGSPVDSSLSEWGIVSKSRIFSFRWPRAGPAIWVRVHFASHSQFGAFSAESSDQVNAKFGTMFLRHLSSAEYGVSVASATTLVLSSTDTDADRLIDTSNLCGHASDATDDNFSSSALCCVFRLSIAAEDEIGLTSATIRFVRGVHSFWTLDYDQLQALVAPPIHFGDGDREGVDFNSEDSD